MKRFLSTLLVSFFTIFFSFALNPDELIGTWVSKKYDVDLGEESVKLQLSDKYTFYADGTVNYESQATFTLEVGKLQYVDAYPMICGSGSYSVEGDSITICIPPETATIKFTRDDVRIRTAELEPIKQQVEQQIFDMLYQNMLAMAASGTDATLSSVVINGKKMTCTDGDAKLQFTRKKK